METSWHYPIFILVSLVVFAGVIHFVLKNRQHSLKPGTIIWVSIVVVVGGMSTAKYGASVGLPVWVYYGVPALTTWVLPPLVFRMNGLEFGKYLILAMFIAPMIHILFSFFLGWNEYMPFMPIPSLYDLLGK